MIKSLGMVLSILTSAGLGYTIIKNTDKPPIPIINQVSTNYANPKAPINTLSYISPIMDKNILLAKGYNSDAEQSFSNSNGTGNQSLSPDSYEGASSFRITDTVTNKEGNSFHYPAVNSSTSIHYPGTRFFLPQGSHLSVNIKAKAKNSTNSTFRVNADGGWEAGRFANFPEVKVTQLAKAGQKEIHVDDVTPWKVNPDDNKATTFIAGFTTDTDVNSVNWVSNIVYVYPYNDGTTGGKIVALGNLNRDLLPGENITYRKWGGDYNFGEIYIKNSDDWVTYGAVSQIPVNEYYDNETRGNTAFVTSLTNGELLVDDLIAGYANKIKLFRDGSPIYEGYQLSFKDTQAKDTAKPNKIVNIQSNVIEKSENLNQIKISFDEPTDNGTEYTYTAKASFDGVYSDFSNPFKSTVKTGIDGYSYTIDLNPDTEPDNTVDIRNNSILKDIPKGDTVYYLHIKPIDKAGNAGDTIHKKIEPLKTTIAPPTIEEIGVTINWDIPEIDTSTAEHTFKVFRQENDGEFIEIASNLTDTTYTDSNISDNLSPSKVSLNSVNYNSDKNALDFIFNPSIDSGNEYSYYIETYLKNGDKISTSNESTTNVISGIKGYSYIVNDKAIDIPDNEIDVFNNNTIQVPTSSNKKYIHIKAIDNAGNASEVFSIKAYDEENPTIDLRLNNYRPTSENINIVITAHDNIAVKSIKLPDGTVSPGKTINYLISKNGDYTFTAYDVSGNSFSKTISVSNIDKTAPSIEFEEYKDESGYKIKIIAKDTGSGISHIILPDGSRINSNNHTISVEPNKEYTFKAYDLAGNYSTRSTQVSAMKPKTVSSNLDLYIKSENLLSLSIDTSSINFEEFSGTEDVENSNAINIQVSSSLPYEINSYLVSSIQNSDKSQSMSFDILNIKASDDIDYKKFSGVNSKLQLLDNQAPSTTARHSIDLMLKGNVAHKKDNYKTTIKFEVNQK